MNLLVEHVELRETNASHLKLFISLLSRINFAFVSIKWDMRNLCIQLRIKNGFRSAKWAERSADLNIFSLESVRNGVSYEISRIFLRFKWPFDFTQSHSIHFQIEILSPGSFKLAFNRIMPHLNFRFNQFASKYFMSFPEYVTFLLNYLIGKYKFPSNWTQAHENTFNSNPLTP